MSAAGVGRVALCLAEAYALAFFTGFTWKLFGVVPALLHERDSVIESKDREIDALLAPPVAIKLGRFVISKRFNKTILSLDISTGTTPTTLRNFQIEADGGREMRSPFISFPETRGEHPQTGSLRLDAFHATSGHLQFAGQASPELQWVLSFKDHTEKTYQELIPREVYSAEA